MRRAAVTPTETAGPFRPLTDLFRSDIRENKPGTVLTLTIKVVNTSAALRRGAERERRDLARRRGRQLLAVRQPGRADLPARHPDHEQQRRGDVHDDLSGLVSGTRDPHPCRSDDQRRLRKVTQIAFPEIGQQHRPYLREGKGDPRWQHKDKLFLGIDHTAIVVKDTEESLKFYRDTLGMKVVGESENYDTEQERLNNVFGARLAHHSLARELRPRH